MSLFRLQHGLELWRVDLKLLKITTHGVKFSQLEWMGKNAIIQKFFSNQVIKLSPQKSKKIFQTFTWKNLNLQKFNIFDI